MTSQYFLKGKSKKAKKVFVGFIQYFCLLAFQILLCIQLENNSMKWSLVFIPLYIHEGFNILNSIFKSSPAKYRKAKETGTLASTFGCHYFGFVLRV